MGRKQDTVQDALFPPQDAVIVAFPKLTAVTMPLLTVATDGLLLLHETELSEALEGETEDDSIPDSPTYSRIEFLLSVTLFTTGLGVGVGAGRLLGADEAVGTCVTASDALGSSEGVSVSPGMGSGPILT